jgi:uncharacterized membrane protein (UPF0127 family)
MKATLQIIITVVILGLLGFSVVKGSYTGNHNPEEVLPAKQQSYQLEVVNTPATRLKGLQGRDHLAPDAGMLFVFEKADRRCMWNKDVGFPLLAVFLNDKGQQVNAARMEAHSEDPVCSDEPVRYVLEINPPQ